MLTVKYLVSLSLTLLVSNTVHGQSTYTLSACATVGDVV